MKNHDLTFTDQTAKCARCARTFRVSQQMLEIVALEDVEICLRCVTGQEFEGEAVEEEMAMGRKDEGWDGSVPKHCTRCGKAVLNGHGNQEETGERLHRFCDACWTVRCEEVVQEKRA